MIDRRTLVAGSVALLVPPTGAQAQDLPSWRLRELVNASSLVVTGIMRPPEPRPSLQDGKDTADIPVYAVVALKGAPPSTPLIFQHTLVEPGIFNTVIPWTLAGRPAILFLREYSTGSETSLALTNLEHAAYKATPELLDAVKREIAAQAAGP